MAAISAEVAVLRTSLHDLANPDIPFDFRRTASIGVVSVLRA
jgi:hypothetical protein